MKFLGKIILIVAAALPVMNVSAGSAKRGVCWDERTVALDAGHASLLTPGVCWVYNWGPDAANTGVYGEDFGFQPMAWNSAYDEARIRAWLSAHPETRWLLGFNEPNFADQARMTPAEAAAAWPALEAIAAGYGVKLVAPALNFSASQVGGRVWNPYEWYDEFFRLRPDAVVDLLALHCYMNWYGANTWFATEYFYADLYNPAKDCYGRYPHLVGFLDRYKEANGHFPKMMLTEFCSWENDGTIKNADFQIDQMTQKVQMLERSDLVEGYAWFMANDANGAAAYPYMSLFERNSTGSGLSELGKVYVGMSAFDTSRFYLPGEIIAAKDYVDATTDDRQIRVRPNTDASSSASLQIEIPAAGYAGYQIDVPAAGNYRFVFRVKTLTAASLTLYIDSKKDKTVNISDTSGEWTDIGLETALAAGRHVIMPYNSGDASLWLNAIGFDSTDSVTDVTDSDEIAEVFTIGGISLGRPEINTLAPGYYLVRLTDSLTKTIKIF